jgi:hypothetical protein
MQKIALARLLTLVAGIALYVASAGIAITSYDEQPRPGWLNALVAVGLAAGGLLALVGAAVQASRERR